MRKLDMGKDRFSWGEGDVVILNADGTPKVKKPVVTKAENPNPEKHDDSNSIMGNSMDKELNAEGSPEDK